MQRYGFDLSSATDFACDVLEIADTSVDTAGSPPHFFAIKEFGGFKGRIWL
ncbi:MAG: hypothetical protein KKE24_00010 [Candidatus Thermoplasmatota archaeon]|nr:hypothetical protein [Candidatus Thermoplasmatota archaeon]